MSGMRVLDQIIDIDPATHVILVTRIILRKRPSKRSRCT